MSATSTLNGRINKMRLDIETLARATGVQIQILNSRVSALEAERAERDNLDLGKAFDDGEATDRR